MQGLFEEALRAEQPLWRLREVTRRLLAQGQEREVLVEHLEHYRSTLRDEGREHDEDIVLEVMDFVVGWSSPQTAL